MDKMEIFRTCLVMRAMTEHYLAEVLAIHARVAENARVIAEAEQLLEISRAQLEEMKSNNLCYDFSGPGTVKLC